MKRTWSTSGVDLHLELGAPSGRRTAIERAVRDAIRSGRLAAGARLLGVDRALPLDQRRIEPVDADRLRPRGGDVHGQPPAQGRELPGAARRVASAGWWCSDVSGPATVPYATIRASGSRPSSAALAALAAGDPRAAIGPGRRARKAAPDAPLTLFAAGETARRTGAARPI